VVTLGLFLLCIELVLNFQVRTSLRESLGWGSGPQVKITAHLNWLSLKDVLEGRISWVRIDGENCIISNLRFAKLHLENQGFIFKLPVLFKERRLEFVHVNKTNIQAIVTASAFSDYLNLYYPQFQPLVKITPGTLIISGQAQIFKSIVPIKLAGALKIVSFKNLRFYPTRLFISGQGVPSHFLRFVGDQIPLQFSLMENWPLEIGTVNLKDGYVAMSFREIRQ
jgi:hypothetical protein